MNIQTEHLEDQTARFTVEIEDERFEKAKKNAARKVAKQVNIPGFRKGKVPYNILVRNGLEPHIKDEAVDSLVQVLYKEVVEQSDLDFYGPGTFEEFKEEAKPTFVYTVPLVPVVELNDYQDIRQEYEQPEATDEQVETTMRRIREDEGVVEESEEPAALHDRVMIDIHSEFVGDDDTADADEDEADDEDSEAIDDEVVAEAEDDAVETDEADDDDEIPQAGDGFIHQHDFSVILDPENERILPGFSEALVGAEVGDDVVFELVIPEDSEDYPEVAGRKISFSVEVKKIEKITLPDMDDDFAARITQDEDEPLTLEQLQQRVRENLQAQLEANTREEYAMKVLDNIVEGADISYPPQMVADQIDGMMEDLDERLKRQGMSLETYMSITGEQENDLRLRYVPAAQETIERSLVLREIIQHNELRVTEKRISERIDAMLAQFGAQAAQLRPMFDTLQMRESMLSELMNQVAFEYIIKMAKGEDVSKFMEEEDATSAEWLEAREAEAAALAEALAAEAAADDVIVADAEAVEVVDVVDAEAEATDDSSDEVVAEATPVVEAEAEDNEDAADAEKDA